MIDSLIQATVYTCNMNPLYSISIISAKKVVLQISPRITVHIRR